VRPAPGPGDGSGRILGERLKAILAITRKDLGQLPRHGMVLLVVLSVVLVLAGVFLFSLAKDEFDKRGVPEWTGSVLVSDGDGGEFLRVEVTVDTKAGAAPLTVTFQPSVMNSEGSVSYEWEFGDEEGSSGERPTHTYSMSGTFTCYLRVRDDRDEVVSSAPVNIMVTDPGSEALQVVISSNVSEGRHPLQVAFSSAVVGGTPPYNYSWDFGNSNTSVEAQPSDVFGEEGRYTVRLHVEDSEGNYTDSGELGIDVSGDEGGDEMEVPFNLLDIVYGYAVLVTLVIVPLAFSSAYKHEMRTGTVRTLTCYPVGVLEVTLAKLLYAAIVGFVFSFVVFTIPTGGNVPKPGGEKAAIFLMAFIVTLLTVAIGALLANSMAKLRGRMVLRPTAMPYLLVWLSFLFTGKIMSGLGWVLGRLSGGDAIALGDSLAALIALSPYHVGGATAAASLGGPDPAPVLAFVVPPLLVAVGWWMSKGVYPDVYEKE
jgi:chitodextrinase